MACDICKKTKLDTPTHHRSRAGKKLDRIIWPFGRPGLLGITLMLIIMKTRGDELTAVAR